MSTLAWPLLAVRLYEVRDMERTVAIVTAVTSPTCRLTICTAMSASGGVQNGRRTSSTITSFDPVVWT